MHSSPAAPEKPFASQAWHRLFIGACLAILLSGAAARLVLPDGDTEDQPGPFAGLFASLPEAWRTWRASPTTLAANRVLEQGIDAFERRLEESSHLRALPPAHLLLAAVGAPANDNIYAGRDRWLFLRGGFDYLTGPPFLDPVALERRQRAAPAWRPAPQLDPRPAIIDFHRQLEARGIHLIVFLAPTKPMVHPEPLAPELTDDPGDTALHNPSFAEFRTDLEQHGITVFEPSAVLSAQRRATGSEQYLRADSHWSPEGLDAAARALADEIARLDLPFTGSSVTWRRRPAEVTGTGDLRHSLTLPGRPQLYLPETVQVQRVVSRRGQPWQLDKRAEILLLGDSFTNIYSETSDEWGRSAGLAEQLSFYLERPLDRIAIDGGGEAATRRRLAQEIASGRDRLATKKLVIWQTAIRTLAFRDWPLIEIGGSG
ncbi:MAG: hypothetical protein AAF657_18950 [Acidobacteriota bacterium]